MNDDQQLLHDDYLTQIEREWAIISPHFARAHVLFACGADYLDETGLSPAAVLDMQSEVAATAAAFVGAREAGIDAAKFAEHVRRRRWSFDDEGDLPESAWLHAMRIAEQMLEAGD